MSPEQASNFAQEHDNIFYTLTILTVIFTLLYGLLLRGLPVKDPGSLVRVEVVSSTISSSRTSFLPYRMFQQLRSQQKSFTDISAWQNRGVSVDLDDGDPRMRLAAFVSGNGFENIRTLRTLGMTRGRDVLGKTG